MFLVFFQILCESILLNHCFFKSHLIENVLEISIELYKILACLF